MCDYTVNLQQISIPFSEMITSEWKTFWREIINFVLAHMITWHIYIPFQSESLSQISLTDCSVLEVELSS